jgi:uncharacterized protein
MTVTELDAPRADLVRMVKTELRFDKERRTLTGYPIVFNKPTMIDSWEGHFREIIAPGAATRTLKNNLRQIKVLFNHGMDPSIGDKPLGKPSVLRQDDKGVYAEVPLSRTSYNDDIIELLNDGALDGQSFRFSVPTGGDTWDYGEKIPTRTITEFKLVEFGPVTFPAYSATTAGVRSREEFSIWRTLSDEQQAGIFQIITATRSASPAFGTDDERPGDIEDMQDSGTTHSSVTDEQREALARALAQLRGEAK